jgi:hypothetical protein
MEEALIQPEESESGLYGKLPMLVIMGRP